MTEDRAVWSTAYINNLPDSAFLYIEPGGSKDGEGKTTPRSLRHFPYRDTNGNVDLPHLRNALARIPQSGVSAEAKAQATAKGQRILREQGGGRSEGTDAIERRYTPGIVELRAGRSRIGGYAAMFNTRSRNLGGFVEQVMPTAFDHARGRDWPGVVARFNHDDNMLLGTTVAGTLQLRLDETGLAYEVKPPQSRADILELVERGDVRNSSFAFRMVEDAWGVSDEGYPLRSLVRVQLVDVAPVVTPAYPETTAALRSLAHHLEVDVEEVAQRAVKDELRGFFVRTDVEGQAKPKTFGPAARMAILARKR